MGYSPAQQFLIDMMKNQLSMLPRPAAGSSFELPAKLGDVELFQDLRMGLGMFNTYPPIFTSLQFNDLYNASSTEVQNGGDSASPQNETFESSLIFAVVMCALFQTGLRLQWFEAGKHFEFNDNGITLRRVKQQDYQNIVASSILAFITTSLKPLRQTIAFSRINVKGLFSGTIAMPQSLTRGLRGTRLGGF
jgi:hypothetical protein